MSKEKENQALDAENLLKATISEEGFALVNKVLDEELTDSDVNKEVINKVVESLKGENNLTLVRLVETLTLLVPLE